MLKQVESGVQIRQKKGAEQIIERWLAWLASHLNSLGLILYYMHYHVCNMNSFVKGLIGFLLKNQGLKTLPTL